MNASTKIRLLAGLLAGGAWAQAAWAEEWDPMVGQNPLRKLGRGLANVISSPLEIPLGMVSVTRVDGPIAGATTGTLMGLAAGVTRLAAGTFEVVTFPAPLPGLGYGPIVEPEYLGRPDDVHELSLTLTSR